MLSWHNVSMLRAWFEDQGVSAQLTSCVSALPLNLIITSASGGILSRKILLQGMPPSSHCCIVGNREEFTQTDEAVLSEIATHVGVALGHTIATVQALKSPPGSPAS